MKKNLVFKSHLKVIPMENDLNLKLNKKEKKFLKIYVKWVRKCHPAISKDLINKLGNAYIQYFRHLTTFVNPNELEHVIKKFAKRKSWDLNSPEQLILCVLSMCGKSKKKYVKVNQLFSNALLMKGKGIAFERYEFVQKLTAILGRPIMIPYSKDLERDLYFLFQGGFVKIKWKDGKHVRVTDLGIKLLKRNFVYYVIKDSFEHACIVE